MHRGLSGSSSILGIFFMLLVFASGIMLSAASMPALPREQPSPGWSRSTKVTVWPSRCRYSAVATPTMPAPTTVISRGAGFVFGLVVNGSGAIYDGMTTHAEALPVRRTAGRVS